MSERRPRLLVFNQYYWPGVEATAYLLAQLCGALADEFDVTVVTGKLRVGANESRLVHDGVTIVRVRSTAFLRANIWLRALNYATYLLGSALAGLRAPKPDVVLSMTDPPVIADVALFAARRFHAPLVVISQDVFPEIAVELKRLQNPLVVGLLRRAIRFYLERADRIVAIGETMRARLEEKGAPAERLRVIPNWADTKALTPQPTRNEWSAAQGLDDRFVVMHSGNIGHAQNLDALVRAATLLRDVDGLTIALLGDGARRDELADLARSLDVDDIVRFLPYQPRDVLPLSLSSADVHVVGLAHGLSGYVVPSRVYGILAVGRPVIVAADPESETAQLVETVGCGIVVAPGQPEALAEAIRRAKDGELELDAMGAAGRDYVVAHADRAIAAERYRRLLRELVSEHSS
jgi:colanic acid biosynthesis glycosyl transferase WcaI